MTVVGRTSLRVLIVEDNEDCAESMATLLRMYGHDVEVAADGPTALENVRANMPDVMLLDIGLPGMNGYDVAKHLCAERPQKTPLIIAVTGYSQDEARRQSAEAGIDCHLVKPVDPNHLKAILERFQKLLDNR